MGIRKLVFPTLTLLLLTTLPLVGLAIGIGSESALASDDDVELPDLLAMSQRRAICGINCVYVFLRLHGCEVTYQEVEQRIGITTEGNSLLSLRQACHHFGITSQIVRSSVGRIDRRKLPVLVHGIHGHATDGAGSLVGHFVVVLQIDGDQVIYMDGTLGTVERAPLSWFDDTMSSGAILEPVMASKTKWDATALTVSTFLVLALLVVLGTLRALPLLVPSRKESPTHG